MAAALLNVEVQSLIGACFDFFAFFFIVNELSFIHENQCHYQVRTAGKLGVNHRLNVIAACAHLKNIHRIPFKIVNYLFKW